jgi:uncharacterized protein YjbI with pentapeptide repeats
LKRLSLPRDETQPNEAAKFVGANFSGAKVTARFSLDDMRGANLSHLKASADMRNQSMGLIRTDFSRANLADANFESAELAMLIWSSPNFNAPISQARICPMLISPAPI